MFGHEKGAFSGAISRRAGRFELAHGGTIFLDEIGEIPIDVQAKLLRVLQEREFERVGGTDAIKVDVRVIAATNREPVKAILESKFRQDLYYRLNVFPITLPPLRERPDDVPLLVQYLVRKFSARIGVRIESISKATMERLSHYTWPGNVRELENILERAVILSNGPTLEIDQSVFASATAALQPLIDLAKDQTSDVNGNSARLKSGPPPETLESSTRSHILATLEKSGWVIDGPHGASKDSRRPSQHASQPDEEAWHRASGQRNPAVVINRRRSGLRSVAAREESREAREHLRKSTRCRDVIEHPLTVHFDPCLRRDEGVLLGNWACTCAAFLVALRLSLPHEQRPPRITQSEADNRFQPTNRAVESIGATGNRPAVRIASSHCR